MIKLKQIVRMTNNLSISIGNTNVVKQQIDNNLGLIDVNAEELYTDLTILYEACKECIWVSANQMKDALKAKLAVDFAGPRDEIEKEIYSLSKYELIKHQPYLIQLITNLMASCVEFNHQEVDSYGFECPLIPKLVFATIRIDNIKTRTVPVQIDLVDSSGFLWTVHIGVHPYITIQLAPEDQYLECFPHRVVFEVLHRELTKTLRRSFVVTQKNEKFVLTDLDYLRADGFWVQNDILVVRIGIRATSVLVENAILKMRQKKQQQAADKRFLDDSSDLEICSTGFYHLRMPEDFYESQESIRFHSDPLTDMFGHKWCLRVKRVVQPQNRVTLGVYVVQLDGVLCRSKYFITLHNKDPSKRIHTSGEEEFSATDQNYGRNGCVDVADLTESSGFVYAGGTLRFQFGVTPITNNGTVVEVAHLTESNTIVTKTILI